MAVILGHGVAKKLQVVAYLPQASKYSINKCIQQTHIHKKLTIQVN